MYTTLPARIMRTKMDRLKYLSYALHTDIHAVNVKWNNANKIYPLLVLRFLLSSARIHKSLLHREGEINSLISGKNSFPLRECEDQVTEPLSPLITFTLIKICLPRLTPWRTNFFRNVQNENLPVITLSKQPTWNIGYERWKVPREAFGKISFYILLLIRINLRTSQRRRRRFSSSSSSSASRG